MQRKQARPSATFHLGFKLFHRKNCNCWVSPILGQYHVCSWLAHYLPCLKQYIYIYTYTYTHTYIYIYIHKYTNTQNTSWIGYLINIFWSAEMNIPVFKVFPNITVTPPQRRWPWPLASEDRNSSGNPALSATRSGAPPRQPFHRAPGWDATVTLDGSKHDQCVFFYLSIHLSIYLSIHLSIYLSIHLSIYLSMDRSIHRSIDLSIYIYIYAYRYRYRYRYIYIYIRYACCT